MGSRITSNAIRHTFFERETNNSLYPTDFNFAAASEALSPFIVYSGIEIHLMRIQMRILTNVALKSAC